MPKTTHHSLFNSMGKPALSDESKEEKVSPHILRIRHNPAEFERLVKNLAKFMKLINSNCELRACIEVQSPQHIKAIIQYVLNNSNEYTRLIKNNRELLAIAQTFPQHTEAVIQHVVNNSDEYKRLIKNNWHLVCLAQRFPKYAEALIQPVLNDPDEWKRLIKNNWDLVCTTNLFPQHAEALIQPVLNNSDEWKRHIASNWELLRITKELPKHAEKFIQYLLNNPNEFKRLITNSAELQHTAQQFPQYAGIFKQASLAEAIKAVKSFLEIRKVACLLVRASSGPFARLPTELIVEIAALTGNPEVHDEKNSLEISEKFISRGYSIDKK